MEIVRTISPIDLPYIPLFAEKNHTAVAESTDKNIALYLFVIILCHDGGYTAKRKISGIVRQSRDTMSNNSKNSSKTDRPSETVDAGRSA